MVGSGVDYGPRDSADNRHQANRQRRAGKLPGNRSRRPASRSDTAETAAASRRFLAAYLPALPRLEVRNPPSGEPQPNGGRFNSQKTATTAVRLQ